MMINTDNLVSMTQANQNFSKVVRLVDESGIAVILKNNKPSYILVDFEDYEQIELAKKVRQDKINKATDELIDDNLEALLELAK